MKINDANLLQQIVNYLEQHRETGRIKKMLYCLCTSRWEKDADYLNSINSQYLIEQIVRENQTLDRFRVRLQDLVKTVNKPKHYIQIAKVIYLSIGQLYPEFQQAHGGGKSSTVSSSVKAPISETGGSGRDSQVNSTAEQVIPVAIQQAYIAEPTQPKYPSQNNVASITPEPTQLKYLSQNNVASITPEPTQLKYPSQNGVESIQSFMAQLPTPQFEVETLISDDIDESAYETYCEPEIPTEMSQPDRVEVPEYDLFVLRQNVMSYTNPLRAKMILLVMLHPNINLGSQSNATIREYYLDDLLLEVLKTYPTIHDLEENMTYAVEQLIEVEEYGKAANGLIQSLASIYALPTANVR
jgi:hypothetical protein